VTQTTVSDGNGGETIVVVSAAGVVTSDGGGTDRSGNLSETPSEASQSAAVILAAGGLGGAAVGAGIDDVIKLMGSRSTVGQIVQSVTNNGPSDVALAITAFSPEDAIMGRSLSDNTGALFYANRPKAKVIGRRTLPTGQVCDVVESPSITNPTGTRVTNCQRPTITTSSPRPNQDWQFKGASYSKLTKEIFVQDLSNAPGKSSVYMDGVVSVVTITVRRGSAETSFIVSSSTGIHTSTDDRRGPVRTTLSDPAGNPYTTYTGISFGPRPGSTIGWPGGGSYGIPLSGSTICADVVNPESQGLTYNLKGCR
jgi:hypothetical protein